MATPKQLQVAERDAVVERIMIALGVDRDHVRRLLTGRIPPESVPGRAAALVRAEVDRGRSNIAAIRTAVSPITPPRQPRERS